MAMLYWVGAGAMLLLALASGLFEHRRRNRHDLERVGWVPWVPVQLAALGGAFLLASLALHS